MAKDTCSECGKPVWRGQSSRPQIVCQECRRAGRGPRRAERHTNRRNVPGVCQRCGAEFMGFRASQRFCSQACHNRRGGNRKAPSYATRAKREQVAPGLTYVQRKALLRKWKTQERLCAYCQTAPVDTVDHVIPLIRGGDNFEGNLVPACRPCNSSKCDWLIVEWRMGGRGGSSVQRSWRAAVTLRLRRGAVRGVQQILSACYVCGSLYQGVARTCGDSHCQREHLGRWTRDKYRAAHGIPVDSSEPTTYWKRLTREAV